ncbi:MAG: hypothetical protein DHS20C05_07360 [Hyphococcus sp.]|nr:MAG: hypothetical protein DHS20C05_07360 [Marinicaulis sp.]
MDEQYIWTFVVDYKGGTYASQFECSNLTDAVAQYNVTDPSGQGAVPLDTKPTLLDGLFGVFCSTGRSKDGALILANIIKTYS